VLTAARSGEVRGARWSEVDLEAKTWMIPGERMKAGREHRVPLSDAACTLLRLQPRAGELVFPAITGNPYSDMVFTALIRRLGFDFTMHGFRSSFRDWAGEQTNYPREVVEMALAHVVENKTEAAYFRSDLFDKRRELMVAWADFCTTAVPAAPVQT
jgi:integrase